ncbi:MAG TPA: Hsp20/alpha crystallin family protein [Anaerolineae bacterium]|nr:Hsp20/alpha crystallin family protein [Anaerolineae bacterium]
MARIVRWDPFNGLVPLRHAVERMADQGLRPPVPFGLWQDSMMSVDMYETDNTVVVKTPIPGVKAEDIQVSVTGDTLTIRAEVKEDQEIKRESYLRQERRYGACCRSVTLPDGLQTDKAEADYSDGVLTLVFPKAEEVKPKTIKVTTKE